MARRQPSPRRRLRKTRWALTILAALITGVWVVSGWCGVMYESRSGYVAMKRGIFFVVLGNGGRPNPMGWCWERPRAGEEPEWKFSLWETWTLYTPWGTDGGYEIAWWPLMPVVLLPASFLWWRHFRTKHLPGACAKCGYDLAGLAADAPCPECGHAAAASTK